MPRQLRFSFDARFCTGCHTCAIACDDTKGRLGDSDRPLRPSFRRVVEEASGGYRREGAGLIPEIRVTHSSESCRHCARPACLAVCPSGAISKRSEDGIVLVEAGLCSGCGSCAAACPFGAIVLDSASGKAEKCDFCLSELESGRPPVCVAACPMRVLGYGYAEGSEGDPPRGPGRP